MSDISDMRNRRGDEDKEHYDDDDDGGFQDVPRMVSEELDRRRQRKSEKPAPKAILDELRRFFLEGGSPVARGGYLSLMRQLGATPRSDDEVTKRLEYNSWFDPATETQKHYCKRMEGHLSEVRLLRYAEFIQHQHSKGLAFHKEWSFQAEEESPSVAAYKDDNQYESTVDYEDYLTQFQVASLGHYYVLAFWNYVNNDQLYHGITTTGITKTTPCEGMGAKYFEIEVCQDSMRQQTKELRERYLTQRRPLGRFVDSSKKAKPGTKQANKHVNAIQERTKLLLQTLVSVMTNTTASARVTGDILDMLAAAATMDVNVARSILSNDSVLILRSMTLQHAKELDADLSRPKLAADHWWYAFDLVSTMLGKSVVSLVHGGGYSDVSTHLVGFQKGDQKVVSEDGKLAKLYFENSLCPVLLKSLRSNNATERCGAVNTLHLVVVHLPFEFSMQMVKSKSTWKLFERICLNEQELLSTLNKRQVYREISSRPLGAQLVCHLFHLFSAHGMTVDKSAGATTQVVPGPLVHKMVGRGVVALLIDMALSPHFSVAKAAVCALGQISRVRDCRLLMLQHPQGVKMIRDQLASDNGQLVSYTMLVVVHLLWDVEWHDALLSIQDDPIEVTAVKWATYCMHELINHVEKMRLEQAKEQEKQDTLWLQASRLAKKDPQRQRIELELKESKIKLENATGWRFQEAEHCRESGAKESNNCLARTLLVLSTLHYADRARLAKVNVAYLASCCLDIPRLDSVSGAASLLNNFNSMKGARGSYAPTDFPDPGHVLETMCLRLARSVDNAHMGREIITMIQLLSLFRADERWSPYFDRASEQDDLKFLVTVTLPGLCARVWSPPHHGSSSNNSSNSKPPRYIHVACEELTGKLSTCSACGKMEGKKGEFKACARCGCAYYCNRDCQKTDWKKHQKKCASRKATRK